jgi:hypothetical protein
MWYCMASFYRSFIPRFSELTVNQSHIHNGQCSSIDIAHTVYLDNRCLCIYSPDLKCAIFRICMYHFVVPSCCLHSGIWTIQRSKEKNAFMLQYNYIPIVICNRQVCLLRGFGIMVLNATFNNISVISWLRAWTR